MEKQYEYCKTNQIKHSCQLLQQNVSVLISDWLPAATLVVPLAVLNILWRHLLSIRVEARGKLYVIC